MSAPSDAPRTDLNCLTVETLRTMKGTGTQIVLAAVCRQLERESARRLKILRDLMPFVLEGYYPECATQEFKVAVEAAKAEVAT